MTIADIPSAIHGCRQTVPCRVLIPADLSSTGRAQWKTKPVDKCLAPLVDAMNAAGVLTRACCCGHAQAAGNIMLHSGEIVDLPICTNHS